MITLLFIAACGVLSVATSFAAIREFTLGCRDRFTRHRDRSHSIPSDDTRARLLARLGFAAIGKCLLS